MIRRKGYPHVSKTFTEKSLASTWAKQTELDMERQTYNDVTLASRTTLREVLLKYRDEGITHLKSARTITSKINIILKDKIADYGLTQLRSKHAWEFKKRISDGRKPKTINMYIDTLNSVWKYARTNLSIAVPAEAPASLVAKSMLPDTFTDGKVADWCDAVIATHKTYKINGAGAVKFKYPPKAKGKNDGLLIETLSSTQTIFDGQDDKAVLNDVPPVETNVDRWKFRYVSRLLRSVRPDLVQSEEELDEKIRQNES